MMDLSSAGNVATIVSAAVPILAGAAVFLHNISKKQNELEHLSMRLDDRLERIEHQFGPNGGGLREAVNNVSKTVLKIEDRVTKIGDDVARLHGEFDQHTKEHNN